jgi:hypothetical protein
VLVWREALGTEVVRREGFDQHICGKCRADEAVVNAAASGRLHKSGCVSYGEQPISVSARQRRKRQYLLPGPWDVG